jgi:peptide/nickel transport system substrate-binding protein
MLAMAITRSIVQTRRRLLAVTLAVTGAALAACEVSTPKPTPVVPQPSGAQLVPDNILTRPPAGTLVHAQYADARTMQPLLARDPASAAFVSNHYNAPLLRRNPETLEWDANEGTAAALTVADGGRLLAYTLRDGLAWSDGTPLTARDYQFTYERMLDPAVDHPYRAVYAHVAKLEVPDDRNLVWTFRERFCPGIDYTVINPIPRHVFEGTDLSRHPESTQPTVGSGPFLLREWNRGRNAVFEANTSFYLGRPLLDRYEIRLVADASEGWNLVKKGEADIASLQASDASLAKVSAGTRLVTHYPVTSSWTYLGMNMRHRVLSDRVARLAIAHAVNREALIQDVRLGHARTLDAPFGRGSWASSAVPSIDFEPERSRRLLDDAGWRIGTEGMRAQGSTSLAFTLRYPTGNREREAIASKVATDLREVGIAIELVAERLADLVDRVNVTHEYDLCLLGWTVPIEPHGTREVWASNGTQNGSGLVDTAIDALYDQSVRVSECGREDRVKVFGEIQRRITESVPCVFLFENESLTATSNRVSVNPLTRLGWDYRPWEWTARG